MGRNSLTRKRDKRKKNRKPNENFLPLEVDFVKWHVHDSDIPVTDTHTSSSSDALDDEDDVYGVDTEVLKMQIEDAFKDMKEAPESGGTRSEYSAEYLIKMS